MSLAVLILLGGLRAVGAPDDVFSELPLERFLDRARAEGRLAILDFTADWCAPCQKMKRTSWVDREVVAWIGDNALAIQVDVDESPNVRRRYRVRTLPTVVALRDGEELGRVEGMQGPRSLLKWMRSLGEARPALAGPPADVVKALESARRLSQDGRLVEAAKTYAWLWRHGMRDDLLQAQGLRSPMLDELVDLARRDRGAMRHVEKLLAKLEPTGATRELAWLDWIELSVALDRGDALVAWVRAQRDGAGRLGPGAEGDAAVVPEAAVDRLLGVLVATDLGKEAAALVPDLAARATERAGRHDRALVELEERALTAPAIELLRDQRLGDLRALLTDYHAAALAAQDEAAAEVVRGLLAEVPGAQRR